MLNDSEGCHAWGDTPTEAIKNLRSVGVGFIQSFKEHGQRLPRAVEDSAHELAGSKVVAEVIIYV